MFGIGVVKGLAVTLREFVQTYVDDIKKIPSRYAGGRTEIDQSQAASTQSGLFTIQYPEEHRRLPERFRYIPMLIYDAETGEDRCTACGICAKVCPPQCIWIVRDRDANGKPITRPAEFDIDASICMNCGLCAEFCPFDAIKMNHEFEISAYTRVPDLIYTLKELRVPTTYYAKIYPTAWTEEEAERAAKAKEKEARTAPAAKPAAATAAAPGGAAAAAAAAGAAAPAPTGGRPTPEELERRRAEARARKAAQ
ncbi:MAG TPA: 4Fe-4S binding protein, partial [Anaerolineae bacterium]